MIEQARLWYLDRSLRERRLLAVAALLAVVALFWAIVVPVGDALSSARQRHADAVIALGETEARVDAVKALKADAPAPLDSPLEAILRNRANEAGFALTTVNPQGQDRVQIGMASARPGALIAWIADLESAGILVDQLTTADNGDRTVSVQMTVKARGV